MKSICVLVTGIGGGGHGEQILKALRLGKLQYRIIGTDVSPLCANKARVDRFVTLPPARSANYLDALMELAVSENCRAIFHGSEPEMMVLSDARGALEKLGFYVPVNPPSILNICQDKTKTFNHLASYGFAVPEFCEVSVIDDINDLERLPVIIKPSVGGGGSANVFIAQTRDELEMFTRYMLKIYDRFIVQEYVGSPNEEYTVGVLFGGNGALINSIAIKRVINNALTVRTRVPNRSGRMELGDNLVVSTGISQGHVADWPEVRGQCEEIAASLRPRAAINIQCRLVNGTVIPFEINPRFSGTTSLRAMVGYNEPEVLICRDILGVHIEPRFPYREAIILRSLEETLVDVESEHGRAWQFQGRTC